MSDTVYSAVKTFLSANWTTTALAWENENHQPTASSGEPVAYVTAELSGNLYDQESFGADTIAGNRWVEDGTLWLHVFVPSGTGAVTARQYARQLAELFMGRELSPSIVFYTLSIGTGQVGDQDGNWFLVSVTADYRRG